MSAADGIAGILLPTLFVAVEESLARTVKSPAICFVLVSDAFLTPHTDL